MNIKRRSFLTALLAMGIASMLTASMAAPDPFAATNLAAGTTAKPVAPLENSTTRKMPSHQSSNGLERYDFFYAGEAMEEKMFIVRDGKIAWTYTHDGKGEISDAILEANGKILFAHQFGIAEVNLDKQVIWQHAAPPHTEIHTAGNYSSNSVWFVQNGNPAKFIIINKSTGQTETEFVLPVRDPKGTHGQFRNASLTAVGTLLVAHMDLGKVAEYDLTGKLLWALPVPGIWSARQLPGGNILVVSNQKFIRELNRQGDIIWEWTPKDTPEYKISNLQRAWRLPNGNTLLNNWFNQWNGKLVLATAEVQAMEITPEKKVVWTLRSWEEPVDLGPATTIQILPR